MRTIISRKQATRQIRETLESLYMMSLTIPVVDRVDRSRPPEYESFFILCEKLGENIQKDEYDSVLSSLDIESFCAFYDTVGSLAEKYSLHHARLFSENRPAKITDLNEVLAESNKVNRKIEFISGFSLEELCSGELTFSSKMQAVNDIIESFFVLDDRENAVNRLLNSFNAEDRISFLNKLQSDTDFLNRLMSKINGQEKDEMLAMIGEMFIDAGVVNSNIEIKIDNETVNKLKAAYEDGKVTIVNKKNKYVTDPFDIVCMNYDGKQLRVPAVLLIKDNINYDKISELNQKSEVETIEKFKTAPAELQIKFLKHSSEKLTGYERGKTAKELRTYRNCFKLNELFEMDTNLMNGSIRDFLNCKEDGTENYTFEEIRGRTGWYEYASNKAACHQSNVSERNVNGKNFKLYNAKFGNPDGREVVFNAKYKVVTNYPDKGTYNYSVPIGSIFSDSSMAHNKYDIVPYYDQMYKDGYTNSNVNIFGLLNTNLIKDMNKHYSMSDIKKTCGTKTDSNTTLYNSEVWEILGIEREDYMHPKFASKEEEWEKLNLRFQFDNQLPDYKAEGYPQSYIDYFDLKFGVLK